MVEMDIHAVKKSLKDDTYRFAGFLSELTPFVPVAVQMRIQEYTGVPAYTRAENSGICQFVGSGVTAVGLLVDSLLGEKTIISLYLLEPLLILSTLEGAHRMGEASRHIATASVVAEQPYRAIKWAKNRLLKILYKEAKEEVECEGSF